MSPFEILMLILFGMSWPFSIYKSWESKSTAGKSIIFLGIVLLGYVAGVIHKLLFSFDFVIYLYILNGLMVSIDIVLYYRNKNYARII